jgi:DNA-binding PadR family transcriptional regulator
LKIYAQGDITEKGAQVLTKSHAYEIQKQLAKRLEILTKGNHNSLYKTY